MFGECECVSCVLMSGLHLDDTGKSFQFCILKELITDLRTESNHCHIIFIKDPPQEEKQGEKITRHNSRIFVLVLIVQAPFTLLGSLRLKCQNHLKSKSPSGFIQGKQVRTVNSISVRSRNS